MTNEPDKSTDNTNMKQKKSNTAIQKVEMATLTLQKAKHPTIEYSLSHASWDSAHVWKDRVRNRATDPEEFIAGGQEEMQMGVKQ